MQMEVIAETEVHLMSIFALHCSLDLIILLCSLPISIRTALEASLHSLSLDKHTFAYINMCIECSLNGSLGSLLIICNICSLDWVFLNKQSFRNSILYGLSMYCGSITTICTCCYCIVVGLVNIVNMGVVVQIIECALNMHYVQVLNANNYEIIVVTLQWIM